MSNWKTSTYLLSESDMNNNAQIVYNYLHAKGISNNAIFGILGNMWRESTVNPCCWQSNKVGNTEVGYGLCQWTPATKILDWLSSNGYSSESGEGQLESLIAVTGQWGSSADPHAPAVSPPFSFAEYLSSTLDIETLTRYFMYYWEKPSFDPAENVVEQRVEHALHFAEILDTSGKPIEPDPPEPIKDNIYTLIEKTPYKTGQINSATKTLLKSLKIGDSIAVKQSFQKNKRFGTNFFGKRLTLYNNSYIIENVRNDGYLILKDSNNTIYRIYLNPRNIERQV